MYDKRIRRRRAVLGALVGLSLLLLTAYFGEPVGGALHSLQRGVLTIFAPVQNGASRALKPARDLVGWFGDTFNAKSERDSLRKQVAQLRQQLVQADAAARTGTQLTGLAVRDRESGLERYQPVTARVIVRSPTIWYATLEVDKGSGDAVAVDQPVVDSDGLVGRVSQVTSNAAQVTLITDHTTGVSARVVYRNGQDASHGTSTGVMHPAVGAPDDLLLDYVDKGDQVMSHDYVVTAGTTTGRLNSLFPPNIPIGEVTQVDPGDATVGQNIHLRPFADVKRLEYVQVLTRPNPDLGTRASVTP